MQLCTLLASGNYSLYCALYCTKRYLKICLPNTVIISPFNNIFIGAFIICSDIFQSHFLLKCTCSACHICGESQCGQNVLWSWCCLLSPTLTAGQDVISEGCRVPGIDIRSS